MKEILVYTDWKELNAQNLVGWLITEVLRGEEVFSFEYNVKNVISNWNQLASEFMISKTEQAMMEQVFNYS
jgi:hypothetical protein